jgi:hypothetical protein
MKFRNFKMKIFVGYKNYDVSVQAVFMPPNRDTVVSLKAVINILGSIKGKQYLD